MRYLKILVFFLIAIIPQYIHAIDYVVEFEGLKDKTTLSQIKNISNLVLLQKKKPRTLNALKYRANDDKDQILKVLHFYGYYDAVVQLDYEEKEKNILVYVFISAGTRYTIKEINIYSDPNEKKELTVCNLNLNDLNLSLHTDFTTDKILMAEQKLLTRLSTCGYPLAKIEKRDIKVDAFEKAAIIDWYVNTGPFCKFGPVKIEGLKDLEASYVCKKIKWRTDQTYNSELVNKTQISLLKTNLFSSVKIFYEEKINEKNQLEMHIKVIEALHKYISPGISYATVDGFGASLQWGNRNFRSQGELLAIEANLAQRLFLGVATYKKPDFVIANQDYVLRFEASRDKIPITYLARDYSMINRLDRHYSDHLNSSIGFKIEYTKVSHSANNDEYLLISIPSFLKLSNTNHLLNPTKGFSIVYRALPFKNIMNSAKAFFKQELTLCYYLPSYKVKFLTLAFRTQIGSIIGTKRSNIPLTELFLGGSDDDLRGYKYRTVSELNTQAKPLGGKSAIFFSAEPRFRLTQTIGLVPFADFGVITNENLPDLSEKWYKSVGIGFRYFSFFGPLRLDIAKPLDRRKNIDSKYKLYINIGQTF